MLPTPSALVRLIVGVVCAIAAHPFAANAQPLGAFSWQLQPFCNRVTVSVTQNGTVFTLDGFDNQCGAQQRAPVVGLATFNPNGTIQFGLSIIAAPGGAPVHVEAVISSSTLSGTWRDSTGSTGPFVFGAATAGPPRPLVGTIGAAVINAAEVQRRVAGVCAADQAVRQVNQDGSVLCQAVGGLAGDITSVSTGAGLTGGSTSGDVTLAAAFGGDGTADQAARSDHEHAVPGTDNTSVGLLALPGIVGNGNTAVGRSALSANTTGIQNTAIGARALSSNTVVANSTAVGFEALRNASTGGINTAVGAFAQFAATTGASNTAVGAFALQTSTTADNNVAVGRSALFSATTDDNVAVGSFAMQDATTGERNTGIGRGAIRNVTTGSDNTGLGAIVGQVLVTGSKVTLIGAAAETATDALTNATALGANAQVATSNSLVLGSISGVNGATANTNVGIGTASPLDRLHVAGIARVTTLGAAGATALCHNASFQISTCSSSLRYKTDIAPYAGGLDLVRALAPIRFTWKADGLRDLGFGAEDVARLDPLLVTSTADGVVEGVKYDRLTAVLVNAVKELMDRNEALERRLAALEALREGRR